MGRAVILRHDLPDGSHHFDLLIEPDAGGSDPDERVLVAWRLPRLPESGGVCTLTADRLAAHRRLYLDYEGPISGGRGSVTRMEAGTGEILSDEPRRFRADLSLATHGLRLEAVPAPSGDWSVMFSPR